MSQSEQNPTNGAGSLVEEFGGSVVNVLLGGLLLWVGQTTMEHNGELAGIQQQLEGMNSRHRMLNERHDRVLESLNNRTKGRFTAEDGDKLSNRIDSLQLSGQSLREQWHDRLAELRVQVSSLEVQMQTSALRPAHSRNGFAPQDATRLYGEVNSIRNDVNRLSRAPNAVYQNGQPYVAPATDAPQPARQASYPTHSGFVR